MLLVDHAAILLWEKSLELCFAAILAIYCSAFIVPAAMSMPARTRMFCRQCLIDTQAEVS